MQHLEAATLPISRWPNGAGRKADLAAGDGWLVSYAWLDQDAPFSDYQGIDRTTILVAGPGFTLDIAGRPPLVASSPFTSLAYDGGSKTHCRVAGPSRVLNVMTARGRFAHAIEILPADGRQDLDAGGALLGMIVLLHGSASALGPDGPISLAAFDALLLDGPVAVTGDPGALIGLIAITPPI